MTTAEKAMFIAEHVHVIANREDAGRCRSDILRLVEQITKCINRPKPRVRVCGKCTATLKDNYGERVCGLQLEAGPDDTTVQCTCGTTHQVEDLRRHAIKETYGLLYTEEEARSILAKTGEPVSERQFNRWRKSGELTIQGWRDVILEDGTTVNRPCFYLDEVQRIQAAYAETA